MTPHIARTLTTIPDLAELNAECQYAPVVIDGPTIVYGKGELGAMAMDYLAAINRPAFHQIDAEWLKAHDRIPEPMLNAQVLVAVARWPYVPIESALTAHGFTNVAPFLDVTPNHPEHPLANGWFAEPLDLDAVQNVLDMFADDVSRAHYVQFLAWRRLREEWTFEGAPVDVEGPRYWPPELASVLVQDHEVFIDGGSYDGKVSERFLYRFGGQCILAEPDAKSKLSIDPRMTLTIYALSDKGGVFPFAKGYDYASKLWGDADKVAVTAPIDVLFGHGMFPIPTFIKLHLEGHELPALRGAAKTIKTHRPILSIACYHQPDTMTDIPLWLREHCEGYRFLWRNHAYVGESAIIYAIPQER